MNHLPNSINNFLYLAESENYTKQLYRLCLEKLKDGHLILLITLNNYDFYLLHKESPLTPEQLKRFIIMQLPSLSEVIKKLLELHNWSLLPSIVVLNLCDYIISMDFDITQLPYCLASLFNYMHSIILRRNTTDESVKQIHSIVTIKTNESHLTPEQAIIFKNLYYYKTDICKDLNELYLSI